MEIAVLDASDVVTNDVVFAVAAVNQQVRDHWAVAYGVEPWPVVCYRDVKQLPAGAVHVLAVVDQVPEGELGSHSFLGTARVLWKGNPDWAQTLSHEVLEMCGNINCNIWLPHPSRWGYRLAYEHCDPCQRGWYSIEAEILGERRRVAVSDFVLPAYWIPGAPGPYSYLDAITEPGGIALGGYQIVRTPDGLVDNLGQQPTAGQRGAMVMARAVAD